MSDIDQGGAPSAEGGDGQGGVGLRVLAQFIRDLSFENPKAPESLRMDAVSPQMDIGVELSARSRDDGLFEVDLKLSAGATRDGAAVFQVELVYGGLFMLNGVPEADIEPVLMIECPRLLFPFARQIIADMSTSGGFPPVMLDPIDFVAIYMGQRAKADQANQLQPGTA